MKSFYKLMVAALIAVGLSLSAEPVNVTYNSPNGQVVGNYYVGPVSLTVNGTILEGFCYDFSRSVHSGDTWVANVYEVSGMITGDGFFDDPFLYKQEAWLASLYGTHPNTEWGNIQYAAWNLLFSSAPDVPGQSMYLNSAPAHAALFNSNHWYALEDVNGSKQSFLVRAADFNTPEPGTLIMFTAGLICIGLSRRR